jgi:uncharacterized protein DUF5666
MTSPRVISRRALLLALWVAGSSCAWAQVRRGDDQGIGGTGITRGNDQGLGGTGIVGIIQRFGSIFVNGERISYASDVPVRIDGEPASAAALKVGHLARVLAVPRADGSLITNSINVVSEVMGPIESVKDGEMTVLGQRIIAAGRESWRRPGTNVAVFGVRRTDGVIVASLVEQRRDATMRVSGPLERDRGGMRIGGLRLSGLDAALVGRRVQAEGRVERGVMQVSRTAVDNLSGFAGARHLSIEGYVRRTGGNLRFGSGYVMHDDGRSGSSGAGRVVVNATFDGSGGLRVDKIQPVKAFPGQTNQGGRTELTPGTTLNPAGSSASAGHSGGGIGVAGTGPPGLRGGGPPGLGGVLPGVGNTVRGLVGGGPPGLGGGGLVGGAVRGVGGLLHGGGKH